MDDQTSGLVVYIPEKHIEEQKYTTTVIFEELWGLEIEVKQYSRDDILIEASNSTKKLSITCDLFNTPQSKWLEKVSLPKRPLEHWIPSNDGLDADLVEETIPVIYGNPGLLRKDGRWHLNLDILGSIFFMLSRYEELVVQERDGHDRFPAIASVAFQEGFLHRPIVDEYLEILWTCIHQLWPDLKRKHSEPQTYISCDVDQPFDCTVKTLPRLLKTCAGDLIKRRSPTEMFKRLNRYVFNAFGVYSFDRNYTFDWYMGLCEQFGLKASFYFIPTSKEAGNGCYELTDKRIVRLMQNIDVRGHEIGVHGSYQTFRNQEKVIAQKAILDESMVTAGIKQCVKGNRQHYLRWDSAITPSLLNTAGFEYDTTGSYADCAGFRYGTGREFSMWCWNSNQKLKLKQRPLLVMDCSVLDERYMGVEIGQAALDYINRVRRSSEKYGGNFTLLWHNSYFRLKGSKEFFKKILENNEI